MDFKIPYGRDLFSERIPRREFLFIFMDTRIHCQKDLLSEHLATGVVFFFFMDFKDTLSKGSIPR